MLQVATRLARLRCLHFLSQRCVLCNLSRKVALSTNFSRSAEMSATCLATLRFLQVLLQHWRFSPTRLAKLHCLQLNLQRCVVYKFSCNVSSLWNLPCKVALSAISFATLRCQQVLSQHCRFSATCLAIFCCVASRNKILRA